MAKNTVLGVDMALVHLKGGGDSLVPGGSDVPDNITPEERKRLEALGVFEAKPTPAPLGVGITGPTPIDDPRVADLEAQLAHALEGRAEAEALAAKVTGGS